MNNAGLNYKVQFITSGRYITPPVWWCSVPAGKKGFTFTGRDNDRFFISDMVLIALIGTITMMLLDENFG